MMSREEHTALKIISFLADQINEAIAGSIHIATRFNLDLQCSKYATMKSSLSFGQAHGQVPSACLGLGYPIQNTTRVFGCQRPLGSQQSSDHLTDLQTALANLRT